MIDKSGKRVSLYAQTGRISIDRIAHIINDHIRSNNLVSAKKAIKEYYNAMQKFYADGLSNLKLWDKQINRIDRNENDIEQYKNSLNNDNVDNDTDIKKPKYRIIKKQKS